MKTIWILMLVLTTWATTSAGQSAPDSATTAPQATVPAQKPDSPAQGSNQIPAGTIIPAELSKSIDAKKAKAGDKVEGKIPTDLLSHGKVVIPRNTKVIGHVTEVNAHTKESPDSLVGIAFDRLVMKDGREVPMQAAIQAIARPLQSALLAGDAGLPPDGGMHGSVGVATGGTPPRSQGGSSPYPQDPPPAAQSASTVAPLGPTSQGAVGMKGVTLNVSGQASVISSETDNVHLEGGTQMILRVL